jgi:hypothetical protein
MNEWMNEWMNECIKMCIIIHAARGKRQITGSQSLRSCESLVCNFTDATFLARRSSRCLLGFWNICKSLIMCILRDSWISYNLVTVYWMFVALCSGMWWRLWIRHGSAVHVLFAPATVCVQQRPAWNGNVFQSLLFSVTVCYVVHSTLIVFSLQNLRCSTAL